MKQSTRSQLGKRLHNPAYRTSSGFKYRQAQLAAGYHQKLGKIKTG